MTTVESNPHPDSVSRLNPSAWRPRLASIDILREFFRLLKRHRRLVLEMAKREITDRFAGSFLGAAWSIAHPLITMIVLVAVFSILFRGTVPPPGTPQNLIGLNFTIHMIAPYLVWMAFTDVLVKCCDTITGNKSLAQQVVFPIEILPVKSVLASLLPQIVGTVFLIAYTLLEFHRLSWLWIFWPLLLSFEFMLLCGIAYLVAAVGVFVRDLREVLTVVTMIGFYVSPILFSEYAVPGGDSVAYWFKPILWCNPASYFMWPFRDVAFHGRFLHWPAWIAFGLGSTAILVVGYRTFRKLKLMFGNAL